MPAEMRQQGSGHGVDDIVVGRQHDRRVHGHGEGDRRDTKTVVLTPASVVTAVTLALAM
ncbi:hypothetical protein [Streptomyces sp. OV198]|jgi:hypothetical protein|uniref:hypothetical protein n=1 Tax=Streptomyces sp. OV198 TaxID=1882787 RepID=UPI00211CF45E|nr:hypothetical protein [Streptomyces sp. OV198]